MFAQCLLNGGEYKGKRIFQAETVRRMTAARAVPGGLRSYGWDVATSYSSNRGELFRKGVSFGHTGFTGTSLWIDPDHDLFVILLANRVNPTRANEQIRQVRPALHDAIMESLGLNRPEPTSR